MQVALAKAKQSSRSVLPKLSHLSSTVERAHPHGETVAREGDCEEDEEALEGEGEAVEREGEGEPRPQPVKVSAEEGKEEEREAPEKRQLPTLQPPTVPPRRR